MGENTVMQSETIGKLAEALAKAQGEMLNAAKDKENPFYKSTYADLASVWDSCRGPLSKNGLSVIQCLNTPEVNRLILTTKLLHSSGEWISSQVPVLSTKQDPQSIGSAITYMRRFSLAALVGIASAESPTEADLDDDDDGNAASAQAALKSVNKIHTLDDASKSQIEKGPITPLGSNQKLNGGQGNANSAVSNKPIVSPKISEGLKIQTLRKALDISEDELMQVIREMDLPSNFKVMTLEQMQQVTKMLEDEKMKMDSAKELPPLDPTWLDEIPHGPAGKSV